MPTEIKMNQCKNIDQIIEQLQRLFESISCLAVEGPEFHTKMEICDIIAKEAARGYDICKSIKKEAAG